MCDTYMRVNENVRQVRQQWGFTCFFTLSFRFLESICIYVGKNTASVKKKKEIEKIGMKVDNVKTIIF